MAVQAQFGDVSGLADEQVMMALLSKGNTYAQYQQCPGGVSAAQSELTCNGAGSSRKRGREASELEQCYASRMMDSRMASTSGRPAVPSLAAEMCRQGAEVDALVRAECDRMRAGLEHARKRQCQALVRAAAGAAARALRDKEAELDAARRRAADLEERVRQAAAESQAWCALARSNEAVAAGLRATLDGVLLRAAACVEGFGAFDAAAAEDDAQSCCFVAKDAADSSPMGAGKWGCKACGEREATVLLLPCRHLCLCKACEPRLDACPVCLAAKNASIHVAAN